jgi:hypothetical protein
MAETHKERVLRLLSDGNRHSHLEGYALGIMLHSRVADLRRDGYTIICKRKGDMYWYRMQLEADTATPERKPAEMHASVSPSSCCCCPDVIGDDGAAQLSLLGSDRRGAYDDTSPSALAKLTIAQLEAPRPVVG